MEDPFKFGAWLGEDMAKKGWAIQGKSREVLEHEARNLITLGYPHETEEDTRTIIAGILSAWGNGSSDDGKPWTENDLWLS